MFDERKAISIVIIRHGVYDPINIRLPLWLLYFIGVIITISLVILISFLWNYGRLQLKAQMVDRLLVENEILSDKNQKVVALATQLDKLQEMDSRIREMATRESGKQIIPTEIEAGVLAFGNTERTTNLTDVMTGGREPVQELKGPLASQQRARDFIPSIIPVNEGWISRDFSEKDQHMAVDISAALNSPIYATAGGVITFSGDKKDYGKLIVIDHQNGFITKYAHNASIAVKKNQRVEKGDVIGYVGNTGHSTSPHLHYEVWKDGQVVDPMHYLPSKIPTKQ